jgi:hypothetical protein
MWRAFPDSQRAAIKVFDEYPEWLVMEMERIKGMPRLPTVKGDVTK